MTNKFDTTWNDYKKSSRFSKPHRFKTIYEKTYKYIKPGIYMLIILVNLNDFFE